MLSQNIGLNKQFIFKFIINYYTSAYLAIRVLEKFSLDSLDSGFLIEEND